MATFTKRLSFKGSAFKQPCAPQMGEAPQQLSTGPREAAQPAAEPVLSAILYNDKWPRPGNNYVEGATQCFQCPVCSSLQKSQNAMSQHISRRHEALTCTTEHFDDAGDWRVSSSFWCRQTGMNRAYERCL